MNTQDLVLGIVSVFSIMMILWGTKFKMFGKVEPSCAMILCFVGLFILGISSYTLSMFLEQKGLNEQIVLSRVTGYVLICLSGLLPHSRKVGSQDTSIWIQ